MYLEGVSNNNKTINLEVNSSVKPAAAYARKRVFEQWKDWQPSQISHHGRICCEIAREWITATDFSELSGDCTFTGPRWLRQKFNWGASTFPIYWCEAVRRETLDCGALAALSHEVFRARGVRVFRVQVVQKFSEVATAQWTNSWNETREPLPWIKDDLIYHEGCAIETSERQIKVWDASAGWWIDPKPAKGYGALLAIRVSDVHLPAGVRLRWGAHTVPAGEWMEIG